MAWNEQGGGFEVSPGGGGFSPNIANRDRAQETTKTGIKPITCKGVHRMFIDDQFRLPDGGDISDITLVGRICSAEANNQRYEYVIGDFTGETLTAKEYIMDDDAAPPPLLALGTYVRVFGTLKSFQGSPNIVCNRIYELSDPNEIVTHLLETTMSRIQMKKGASLANIDPNADLSTQVKRVIVSCKTLQGISTTEIKAALPAVPMEEILKVINHLSGEGYIFSTIDDDHFKATEDS